MSSTDTAARAAERPARRVRRALTGGVLLGVGLGGFVDGIVLHQILQWHHMLTDRGDYARFPPGTVADLQDNALADGLFHVAAFAFTVAGMLVLYGAARRGETLRLRPLAGTVLVGWGLFNLVEGVIDHHLLSIHHVRDDVADPLPWDVGFLAVSALLVLVGLALARTAGRPAPVDPR